MSTRTTLALAAAALLGGCAYSPGELRESAPPIQHQSGSPAKEVAACIARNAATYYLNASVYEREAGHFEVVVTLQQYARGAFALAEIAPGTSGARSSVWVTPSSMDPADSARKLLTGC